MTTSSVLIATFLIATFAGCFSDSSSQVEHANVAFDVCPDGELVVFASAGGDLFQFNVNTRTVSQLTKSTAIESSPVYSSDGKNVIYTAASTDRNNSHIFRIMSDGTQSEQLTRGTEAFDLMPVYSLDGLQIAFARAHKHRPYSMGGWTWDDWDIYVMDVDGSNVARLTHNNYYGISGVEFSPNGTSIFFSADNNRVASDLDTNVFEVSANGSVPPKPGVPQPTSIGKYAAWASEPAFSPDGKTMVVISDRKSSYKYDLLLIDADFANTKSLNATTVSRYNKNPVFAEDGRRVFFLAGTKWNSGSRPIFSLWSIDVDGTNAREIADSELFTAPMKWPTTR
jgi:TolB protein